MNTSDITLNSPYQLTINKPSIEPSGSADSWWSATVNASMTDKKFIGETQTRFSIHAESHSSDASDIEHELMKIAHHHMQYLRSNRERVTPSTTWTPTSPLSPEPNIYTFMHALDAYLCQRFKYRNGPCRKGPSQNISVNRSAVSLYLNYPPGRYEHLFSRAFVIAKASYAQSGKGHGTDLLRFLLTQAEVHNFQTLVLESVLSDEGIEFAKARGFHRDPANRRNWFVAVKNLHLPSI